MKPKTILVILVLALLAACAVPPTPPTPTPEPTATVEATDTATPAPAARQAGCPPDPPTPTPRPVQPTYTPLVCDTPTPTCPPTATSYVEPSPTPHPTQPPCPGTPPPTLTPGPVVNTANPNASPETRQVLAYLAGLPQGDADRVVSGQHIGDVTAIYWEFYAPEVKLFEATGRWIGFYSADYSQFWKINQDPDYNHKVSQRLIEYWNAGGLIEAGWGGKNPWTNQNQYSQRPQDASLTDLLQTGTSLNSKWLGVLDVLAGDLQELEDAGVVVLWRPMAEMNGTWFWWGDNDGWPPTDNAEEFKALWRHMFEYFTYEKGLNNLLWVYSPYTWNNDKNGNALAPADLHYPGDGYVDIVAPTYYQWPNERGELGYLPDNWGSLVELGKPLGVGEFGPWCADLGQRCEDIGESFDYVGLIEGIRNNCPEITYFVAWNRESAIVENQNGAGLLNDPWVITREEVDWR